MSRKFKRTVFSGAAVLLTAIAMTTAPLSVANAANKPISRTYIMPSSANGHRYTIDNHLVCDADSLSVFISNGESSLEITGGPVKIVEIEKEPVTSDEINKLGSDSGSTFYYAKDTLNVFSFKPVREKEGEYEKVISIENPEIKYIMDGDNGTIIDYKTEEVLHTFEDKSSFCYYYSEDYGFSNRIIFDSECNSIHGSPDESPIALKYLGDIDENGCVDITDLSELSLYLIGDKEFTDDMSSIFDMTNDGSVDLSDLASLKKYISKK